MYGKSIGAVSAATDLAQIASLFEHQLGIDSGSRHLLLLRRRGLHQLLQLLVRELQALLATNCRLLTFSCSFCCGLFECFVVLCCVAGCQHRPQQAGIVIYGDIFNIDRGI